MKNGFLLIILPFILKMSSCFYESDQFPERFIKGTEIIHVMLDMNSNSNTVKNYIIKNINHNFNGYVSDNLSYNSNPNGNINNYLKGRDKNENLLAIYFDGGKREGRDNYYDYINLRWLGKGSSHMYCFWKSYDNIKTLQYNNIIKISHFLNNNPIFSLLTDKIKKKIIEKISNKSEKEIKLNLKVKKFDTINKFEFDYTKTSKDIVDLLTKFLSNDEIIEAASDIIDEIENISMGIIEAIEKEKILGGAAKVGLEILKTIKTITTYKLDMLFDITDNIFDSSKYKEINNAKDVYDDTFIFIEGIGDGIQKSTVNTVKNVGHGIKDVLSSISDDKFTNCIGDIVEGTTDFTSKVIDKTLDGVGEVFYGIRDGLRKLLFE